MRAAKKLFGLQEMSEQKLRARQSVRDRRMLFRRSSRNADRAHGAGENRLANPPGLRKIGQVICSTACSPPLYYTGLANTLIYDNHLERLGRCQSALAVLDTYRTMCVAPEPDFLRVLEEIRRISLDA
jgi:hypothetical protein